MVPWHSHDGIIVNNILCTVWWCRVPLLLFKTAMFGHFLRIQYKLDIKMIDKNQIWGTTLPRSPLKDTRCRPEVRNSHPRSFFCAFNGTCNMKHIAFWNVHRRQIRSIPKKHWNFLRFTNINRPRVLSFSERLVKIASKYPMDQRVKLSTWIISGVRQQHNSLRPFFMTSNKKGHRYVYYCLTPDIIHVFSIAHGHHVGQHTLIVLHGDAMLQL